MYALCVYKRATLSTAHQQSTNKHGLTIARDPYITARSCSIDVSEGTWGGIMHRIVFLKTCSASELTFTVAWTQLQRQSGDNFVAVQTVAPTSQLVFLKS